MAKRRAGCATNHRWQAASKIVQASSKLPFLVFPQLLMTAPARAAWFGGPGGSEGEMKCALAFPGATPVPFLESNST